MDTLSTYPLIIVLITMLLSAFFAGMEIAFVSANKVRLEIDIQKGGLVNRIIHSFYSHSDVFISTMLVGNNVVNVVYSMAMASLISEPINAWLGGNEFLQLILITIISTVIILITGEFLPKAIFRINPNASLRMFSLPLFMCYCVLYPLSRFTEMLSQCLMRLIGIKIDKAKMDRLTVEELDAYLQETIDKREDENEQVEREVKIFENALDFSNTYLRDCMVPRNEIVAVDINQTDRDGLVEIFSKTGLSKLVVYHDDIDNVLGFISVSELFVTDVNWKDRMKPVLFAPETMLAKNMMQNLLKKRRSMAIVVDEFGGTSGLVTLEDLVEEIFGDIQDEHDHNALVARKLNETTFEFSGRMEIEEINESHHLDLPESDDYQTIAGLLLNHLGAIPNEGDTVDFDSFKVTVLKKNAARVELVRLVVNPSANHK